MPTSLKSQAPLYSNNKCPLPSFIIIVTTIFQVPTMYQELDLSFDRYYLQTPQPPYKVANINFLLKLIKLKLREIKHLIQKHITNKQTGRIHAQTKYHQCLGELLSTLPSLPTLRTHMIMKGN